jgi:hypothetical protein
MAPYHYQAALGLAPQEVWFVGYILAHRWTADLPYPSLRRMSRRTGVSTQMLHRYKQSLIEKGYLVTLSRYRPSGGRTSNYYDFTYLFQSLERLLTQDRRGGAWHPSADESLDDEESLDQDGEDNEGQGDPAPAPVTPPRSAAPAPSPTPTSPVTPAAARASLPPSQQPVPLSWSQAIDIARQRGLPGAGSPRRPTPEQADRPGAGHGRRSRAGERAQLHEQSPFVESTHEAARHGDPHNTPSPEDVGRAAPPRSERTLRALQNASLTERWVVARQRLAGEISPAAFGAWIEPLHLASDRDDTDNSDDTPTAAAGSGATTAAPAASEPVKVVCASAFQRQQIERRYLAALARALGAPVELIVAAPSPETPPALPPAAALPAARALRTAAVAGARRS